jgi:acetate kinase
MTVGPILVLNAGSSSLKYASYDRSSLTPLTHGQVDLATSGQSHSAALRAALAKLAAVGGLPSAVGHRVVHGGALSQPALITPEIRAQIEVAGAMASLHNPPALKVIDAVRAAHPDLPQIACFDTAFHAGNPLEATSFALPETLRAKGLRRYGFHGLSYASTVRRFKAETGLPLPNRLMVLHLGAGASLAAILNGKGVATTMGFSPLDGLTMATRAGSLDPGLLLYLLQHEGMSAGDIDHMLNHQSGLSALGGSPDMKTLLESNTPEAQFAVSHFVYWAARHAGSMIAAMQGIDGIVFTGGIGENAEIIRSRILDRLRWTRLNPTRQSWVIAADEEGEIVQMVKGFL